jgi:hypothetical protein
MQAYYKFPNQLVMAAVIVLTAGCASLLPKSKNESSEFKSFEEARLAIEGLTPMKSTLGNLSTLGIDPIKHPNTTILTHADVVRRFVPGSVLGKNDLDPGVVSCLEARDACRGMDVVATRIEKNRTGNFLADFFNFSRRTDTTGWRFNAVILLVNNVVVYRTWGGQPSVNETEVRTNPLGPLQDSGPSTVSVSPSVVVR